MIVAGRRDLSIRLVYKEGIIGNVNFPGLQPAQSTLLSWHRRRTEVEHAAS